MPASLPEPAQRVEPFCPYFGACGGCTLQHFGPASYAAFKHQRVGEALTRAGIETALAPLVDAHGTGRRRATLHTNGKAAGYFGLRSHDLVDIAACPILVPTLRESAPKIARQIGMVVGDADVSFTSTATGIDVSVRTGRKGKPARLTVLAQRLDIARLTLDGETVLQRRPPAIRIGQSTIELPAGAFLQATAKAEEILAALVLDGIGTAKSVADLFCGVGVFALRLATRAKVYAADADRPSIAALEKAVRHTQGLKPVAPHVRDLFRNPLAPVELAPFDAVVFDPPRAGAEAQARELAASKVRTVVAVSCEPKTFARDAAILIAGGYRLEQVTPVDQFAWSTHVELVATFRR